MQWRSVAHCLAPHGVLSMLSCGTQDHWPEMALPTVIWALPHHHQQRKCITVLPTSQYGGSISQFMFLLENVSSLWQVDTKLASEDDLKIFIYIAINPAFTYCQRYHQLFMYTLCVSLWWMLPQSMTMTTDILSIKGLNFTTCHLRHKYMSYYIMFEKVLY